MTLEADSEVNRPTRAAPLLSAVLSIYGPFGAAAVWTWLFVTCGHCKRAWLELLWAFPGLLSIELGSAVVTGSASRFPAGLEIIAGGLLSLLLVFGVALMVGRDYGGSRIVLPITTALATLGAMAAFALVRS